MHTNITRYLGNHGREPGIENLFNGADISANKCNSCSRTVRGFIAVCKVREGHEERENGRILFIHSRCTVRCRRMDCGTSSFYCGCSVLSNVIVVVVVQHQEVR